MFFPWKIALRYGFSLEHESFRSIFWHINLHISRDKVSWVGRNTSDDTVVCKNGTVVFINDTVVCRDDSVVYSLCPEVGKFISGVIGFFLPTYSILSAGEKKNGTVFDRKIQKSLLFLQAQERLACKWGKPFPVLHYIIYIWRMNIHNTWGMW